MIQIPSKEELKNFIKQSKLNEQEMHNFLKATEEMDPKIDHRLAYRIMTSEFRRDILKFINNKIREFKEIQDEFHMEQNQLKYHLSMLKQGLYVLNSNNKWKATPRGLGFLANAKLE